MANELESVFLAFQRHLEKERNLSVHTIRAYCGDLESLIAHLETLGLSDFSQLTLLHLRSWLANQQVKGERVLHFRVVRYPSDCLLSGLIKINTFLQMLVPHLQRQRVIALCQMF